MSTLNNFYTDQQKHETSNSIFQNIVNRISRLSESIWLGITFLLFVLMGPFSVIAVLYGLWTLGSSENREKMVEPASC